METLEKFYNQKNNNQYGAVSHSRSRLFNRWIGKGKKILSIGCADGSDCAEWIKNGNEVWGTDLNRKELQAATKKGVKARYHDISKSKLPYKNNSFDIVVASDIIEHVIDTDGFLDKIRKVLKKNGSLILTTPNVASLGRRLFLLFGKNPYLEYSLTEKVSGLPPVGHLRYFTQRDLIHLVKKHGFKVDSLRGNGVNFILFYLSFLGAFFPRLSGSFWVRVIKS